MPPPSPPLFLLDRRVHIYRPDDDTANIQGRVLTSGVKQAFGFGEDHDAANSLVQGLELELGAELDGETDLSFLILRGERCRQYSGVHTVDRNLVLIASAFLQIYPYDVFLIYDAVDRSLRMIPNTPYTGPLPVETSHVLVARRHDDDRSYALIYPGRKLLSRPNDERPQDDVLFVWPSSSTTPWEMTKKANFPSHLRSGGIGRFDADQVFASRGRGYWVDLLRGAMYCDCGDVLSNDIDCVDVRSFDLPAGCKYSGYIEDIAEARAFRAMGPVGDSIRFVSIDGYLEKVDLEDCKVRVWRLMEDTMSWAVEHELELASLWEFQGNDSVPRDMAPMYPFLTTEEENNVIYFAMGSLIRGVLKCFPEKPCCMLRVDMHSKTVRCTGLSESQRSFMTSHLALSPGMLTASS